MNLIPNRWRRNPRRAAQDTYFAIDENPAADAARDTLRHSADPDERQRALGVLADRELGLYHTHDDAFGYQPWAADAAGDAATALAHGAMALRLLRAAERARDLPGEVLGAHWTPTAWPCADLAETERALADACAALLARLATHDDPTEQAVLHTRLWIAAYPVIGGQAAEWIAVLGNDWQCRAAGVQDGPETILTLPDAAGSGARHLPSTAGGEPS